MFTEGEQNIRSNLLSQSHCLLRTRTSKKRRCSEEQDKLLQIPPISPSLCCPVARQGDRWREEAIHTVVNTHKHILPHSQAHTPTLTSTPSHSQAHYRILTSTLSHLYKHTLPTHKNTHSHPHKNTHSHPYKHPLPPSQEHPLPPSQAHPPTLTSTPSHPHKHTLPPSQAPPPTHLVSEQL